MKFLMDNWMLMLVALSSGTMLLWPTLMGGSGAGSVSTQGAVQLMNREKAVVIDVCDATEFASGHVAGAKNVPLAKLQEQLPGVVKNKALPVILVCGTGMRSRSAVATAKKLGYENAQSLSGGMNAWQAANLPTEKA